MSTATQNVSDAALPKNGQRIKTARDAAPPLVPNPRKNRAAVFPAPPLPASGARAMAEHERAVIDAALSIVRARLRTPGSYASDVGAARSLAILHYADHDIEGFGVMFLDSQNGLIAVEELFTGTLKKTSVHPREVVRAAMRHNAASVILMHNHPAGNTLPSLADTCLTRALTSALCLVDVRVVDHLIVAGDQVMSFAELGLL
jgi:DNA repair protein RadC